MPLALEEGAAVAGNLVRVRVSGKVRVRVSVSVGFKGTVGVGGAGDHLRGYAGRSAPRADRRVAVLRACLGLGVGVGVG